METDTLAFVLGILRLDIHVKIVCGCPGRPPAQGSVTVGVCLIVQGDVPEIAVPLQHASGQAHCQRIRNRAAEGPFYGNLVRLTVTRLDVSFRLLSGGLGGDDYGSVGRIAAIQRTLRAFYHFYLLGIEYLADKLAGIDHQNVVHHHGNRQLAIAYPAQAAYREKGRADGLRFSQGDIRCELDEICRLGDTRFFNLFCGKGGHRDRGILDILLDLAGGNDDFLQDGLCGYGLPKPR